MTLTYLLISLSRSRKNWVKSQSDTGSWLEQTVAHSVCVCVSLKGDSAIVRCGLFSTLRVPTELIASVKLFEGKKVNWSDVWVQSGSNERWEWHSELVGVTYGVSSITLSTAMDSRSVGSRHLSWFSLYELFWYEFISDQNSVLMKVYEFKTEWSLSAFRVSSNSRQSIIWLLLQLMSLIRHSQLELRVRRISQFLCYSWRFSPS